MSADLRALRHPVDIAALRRTRKSLNSRIPCCFCSKKSARAPIKCNMCAQHWCRDCFDSVSSEPWSRMSVPMFCRYCAETKLMVFGINHDYHLTLERFIDPLILREVELILSGASKLDSHQQVGLSLTTEIHIKNFQISLLSQAILARKST